VRGNTKRAVDERRLLMRYREHGDMAAREELTRRLMPLARQLAMRYQRRSESLEDLVQVANLALVKAIDRFDPERGTALSTYAVPTILGELRRYFRDAGWSVHMSRELQERTLKVEHVSERLTSQHSRSPSVAEVAAEMDLPEEDVVEALQASTAYQSASLDEQIYEEDGSGSTLMDVLGGEDDGFELVEDRSATHSAMRVLDERARKIVELRFIAGMTQSQIGDELGVSQMHVSRLLRRALATLRDTAAADGSGPRPR
jgi:RNA polymerase sigma-B factor